MLAATRLLAGRTRCAIGGVGGGLLRAAVPRAASATAAAHCTGRRCLHSPSRPSPRPPSTTATEAPFRTHLCSAFSSASSTASSVTLSGWLQSSRDLGECWFGLLRDHTGTMQLTWTRSQAAADGQTQLYEALTKLPIESVVSVQGRIEARPAGMTNAAQTSGAVELHVTAVTVLNTCTSTLPFSLEAGGVVPNEDQRLRFRFLDLRRDWMQRILQLRNSVMRSARTALQAESFVEVETPILFKSTPEGADEFIVPSRHAGRFYALPQSPQQHKQLLMMSGVAKYFQVARCFRDEGSRADRQPEFTQLDLEMAFVRQQDVMGVIERTLQQVYKDNFTCKEGAPQFPMRQLTYQQVLSDYGVDKPDMRFDLKLSEITSLVRSTLDAKSVQCGVFEAALAHPDACIQALPVRGLNLSRKERDVLQKDLGKGVLLVPVTEALKTPAMFQPLFAHPPFVQALTQQLDLQSGDLLMVVASHSYDTACDALGRARTLAAHLLVDKKKLTISAQRLDMAWVVDFPLFKCTMPLYTAGVVLPPLTLASLQLKASHHPFTAPVVEDAPKLHALISGLQAAREAASLSSVRDVPLTLEQVSTLRSIRGQTYDVVCNGIEVGGGSIRIHEPELQTQVLHLIGAPIHVFEHMLSALRFGAPPHGGIALGVDRVIGLLGAALQEQLQQARLLPPPSTPSYGISLPIREVIAFPKTTSGQDIMVDAPSAVPHETLKQYHIQTCTPTTAPATPAS